MPTSRRSKDWVLESSAGPVPALEGVTTEDVERLVADLGSRNAVARHRAHVALVAIGHRAVVALVNKLQDQDDLVRLGAVTALGEIGDPIAAEGLVNGLEDQDFGVRWASANALMKLGCTSVEPVLRALTAHATSLWLRRHGGRVLRRLSRSCYTDLIWPVTQALKSPEPELVVPPVAWEALQALERQAAGHRAA